jgi:hypothetical protein
MLYPMNNPPQQPSQPQPPTFGEFAIGVAAIGLSLWGVCELLNTNIGEPRACGICGRMGHNRRTCPHAGQRLSFSRSIPKSQRCECCGSSRYRTQRHHTNGRSSLAAFLDVCFDCHLTCCHEGHFHNLGGKPRTCRLTGRRSHWRS